jgi:hypothetical protein
MKQDRLLPYGSLVAVVLIVVLFIVIVLLAMPQRTWPPEKTTVGFAARSFRPTMASDVVSENTCADSDKGISYFMKGVVTGFENNKYYKYTDFCTKTSSLVEYYCEKQQRGWSVKTQSIDCSQLYGKGVLCKEGLCAR